MPRETNALHMLTARAALPHIRVETLIGSQATYEIKIKITIIPFYQIMLYYKKNNQLIICSIRLLFFVKINNYNIQSTLLLC